MGKGGKREKREGEGGGKVIHINNCSYTNHQPPTTAKKSPPTEPPSLPQYNPGGPCKGMK